MSRGPVLPQPPGLNIARLVALMRNAVQRCELDLAGATVLTEAALGPYLVTPVVAAMAGAEVLAFTTSSRYGTAREVREQTFELATAAGVAGRLDVVLEKTAEVVRRADIVTNSGHLRPIDERMIRWMKPTAVVPLRYESWEYRASDLDLTACRRHGIAVAGTNECHPAIDVFSYLGAMAVRLLFDAGIAVYGCRVLVLCDNPFARFIGKGLRSAGADVTVVDAMLQLVAGAPPWDAVLVAMTPRSQPVLGEGDVSSIASHSPGTVVVQYWGDLDRDALSVAGVPCWPDVAPPPGHMYAFAAIGAEPVVRLQAGGLKVGEVMWRARISGASASTAEDVVERSGWGQRVHGEGF
jgi:hypothetical protein